MEFQKIVLPKYFVYSFYIKIKEDPQVTLCLGVLDKYRGLTHITKIHGKAMSNNLQLLYGNKMLLSGRI